MTLISILLQTTSAGSSYSGLIMIVLIFVIMYFFMIRPQQKQRKKIEAQRAALKEGDKVVISGGIHGKLKNINDTSYIIEIAEKVKIEVDKLSVFAVNDDVVPGKFNKRASEVRVDHSKQIQNFTDKGENIGSSKASEQADN